MTGMRYLIVFACGLATGMLLMLVAWHRLPPWPWELPALMSAMLIGASAQFWPRQDDGHGDG